MSESNALQQAKAKVHDLLEAAETRNIVPIHLPGQIQEIIDLLEAAEQEKAEAAAAASSAVPGDMADYMKEEAYFVGHAVHELRTPMTVIRGYVDMLGSMGELNDMQQQFMGTIKQNTRRMESLLKDVSFINKIRKDTLQMTEKMDMFKNIAMKVEKDMSPVAEDLGKELIFEIPQGLPLLNIDGDLLSEALNRLVENGLRYSGEDGRVLISAESEDDTLVIRVEDNGIGMDEEVFSHLGEIYYRADDDLVREFKGSGLGIPIALGMIEKIGGTIDIQSEPGTGTTIIIRIKGMT